MKKQNLILISVFLFLIPIAFSQSGLEKIQQYNREQAVFYLQNLSFFVAFVGGMISVLLPCTLAILPAFFAYTFKERKEITKMTLVFFVGFSLIFIILGIFASAIGQTLASIQVANTKMLVIAAGVLLMLFGIMTILGKGFNFISLDKKTGHDIFGIFSFGILFGLGWSACLGPVLAGILLIASTFHNYFYAGALLFFYSLGLFVPLFLISIFFDKFNLTQASWIKGKEFEVKIFGKPFFIHTTKVAAGILLIASGLIFIIYNGTTKFNTLDPLKISIYAYIFEGKLFKIPYIDFIGFAAFLLFVSLVWYFIYRRSKENQNAENNQK
ncbi:MAG TPA: cytochrome c biogenesis CcdA family protein [Candidatus Nanoarchaeia archaeon]|nr:cytochrome c biogenesis CcdA family protein [Candidatus Nanoarchaeia archaeon]